MKKEIMKPSKNAINLIKKYEGFSSKSYYCPSKVLTIGYGTTVYHDGKKVKLGDTVTEAEAMNELKFSVEQFSVGLNSLIKVPLTQNQFDSLVSFTYNIGINAFASSTLLKLLNSGNYVLASKEFHKWVKSGKQTLQGLINRREEESALFLKDFKKDKFP
jgi:lysozyme